MIQQIEFEDVDGTLNGGIMLDNGDIVCMCCGGLFLADEQEEMGIKIIHIFPTWLNLSQEIIGE